MLEQSMRRPAVRTTAEVQSVSEIEVEAEAKSDF